MNSRFVSSRLCFFFLNECLIRMKRPCASCLRCSFIVFYRHKSTLQTSSKRNLEHTQQLHLHCSKIFPLIAQWMKKRSKEHLESSWHYRRRNFVHWCMVARIFPSDNTWMQGFNLITGFKKRSFCELGWDNIASHAHPRNYKLCNIRVFCKLSYQERDFRKENNNL